MTRIQPFPAPCAEKARAALPRPAGTAVFMLTHEARSALCGRFGLEDSQLDRALGLLGAAHTRVSRFVENAAKRTLSAACTPSRSACILHRRL